MEDNKKVIIKDNTWHFPFVSTHFDDDWDLPRSECSYYRTLFFSLLTYPLWRSFKRFVTNEGFWTNLLQSWVLLIVLCMGLGAIYGSVDLLFFGAEFNDENGFHLLSFAFLFLCTVMLTVGACFFINGLWEGYKTSLEEKEWNKDEEDFSFTKNFMKFKRKICRPVEYRSGDE